MIKLFTGVPGAGKTYRMVYDLLKLPPSKYYIWHNIDGLLPDVIESGAYIQVWTEIEDFLTREKQQQLSDRIRADHNRQMLVIIDEAWEFLGRKSKAEPEAVAWLKMHRHMDQQVWICTQSYKDLSQAVYDIVPVEIRAKRGITGSQYIYQHNVRGETFKTERLPRKKSVYNSYVSFQGTGERVRSTKTLWVGLALLVFFVGLSVYCFGPGLRRVFSPSTAVAAAKTSNPVSPAALPVPPAPPPPKVVQPPNPADPLAKYSFAGCAGSSWWVQAVDGGALVKGNSVHPDFVVTGCERGMVVLMSGKYGVMRLARKSIINIPDAKPTGETLPPAGSQGGAQS